VEIGLRNGRIVRAAADLPENLLMRAIRIAESA
jgi:transposase